MSALTGMLLMFVITLAIGHWIKKTRPEAHKGFVISFGRGVIVLNAIAVGMILLINHPNFEYIDKISAVFLNLMVIFIMITLIKLDSDGGKEGGDNGESGQ